MLNIISYSVFIIFTIYAFIRATSYAIYEIKQEKNNSGGIAIIIISAICVIFSNIVFLLN